MSTMSSIATVACRVTMYPYQSTLLKYCMASVCHSLKKKAEILYLCQVRVHNKTSHFTYHPEAYAFSNYSVYNYGQ